MTPIWAPYGTAYVFRAPIIKASATDFATSSDWTYATGDVKVIQDGTVLGNITTPPSNISTTSTWTWSLSAAEMAADEVIVQVVDSATKAVQDQMFRVITLPQGALRSRKAQGGASTTVTLDTGSSSVNDYYNGSIVAILAGTGTGQARVITGYVGSSRVATVDTAWATNPDSTSVFAVYPQGIYGLTQAQISSTVSSALTSYGVSTLTSAQVETSVMDTSNGVEAGMTFRQAARLMSAVLLGKRSGTSSGTEVFRAAVSDSKVRVTGTINTTTGDRTSVSTDAT